MDEESWERRRSLLNNQLEYESEGSVEMRKRRSSDTPMGRRIRLVQQMTINVAYAATSLSIGVRGATLLDLTQLYASDVETLSMNLVFYSVTKAIGCLVCGEVLQRAPHMGYLWFFVNLLVLAAATTLTPFLPSVEAFFAAAAALGFAVGCMHTSAGVLSMALWPGGAGTHMHILMAFFSTGGFLAPLLAKPFLSHDEVDLNNAERFADHELNVSMAVQHEVVARSTAITILYPLIGGIVLVASIGPLIFGLHDGFVGCQEVALGEGEEVKKEKGSQSVNNSTRNNTERMANNNEVEETSGTVIRDVINAPDNFIVRGRVMVCLALSFCIVVTAYDFGTSSFLATFAVTTSNVELSKEDGADLLAVFMGASAAFRMLSIILSMRLRPSRLATLLFVVITSANLLLVSTTAVWSKAWLMFCFALQAAISPLYGNNWVWLNQYVVVNGRTGSFITAIASVGNILSPILIGQMVNSVPMVFIYFELIAGLLCCAFYLIGGIVGRPILQAKKSSTPL